MLIRIVLIFSIPLFLSCGRRDEGSSDYKKIYLEISVDSLSDLRGGGLNKPKVSAFLRVDEKNNIKCSISLSGNSSIDDRFSSYNVRCPKGMVNGIRSFKISSQTQDKSKLKTVLALPILKRLDIHYSYVEPIEFFVNGKTQGLFFFIERVDDLFFLSRSLKADYLLKSKTGVGVLDSYTRLDPESAFSLEIGNFDFLSVSRLVDEAQGRIALGSHFSLPNISSFYSYLMLTMNTDGSSNNYFLYGIGDQWFFVPWDWDHAFSGTINGAVGIIEKDSPLLSRLRESQEGLQLLNDNYTKVLVTERAEVEAEMEESYQRVLSILEASHFHGDESLQRLEIDYQKIMKFFEETSAYLLN